MQQKWSQPMTDHDGHLGAVYQAGDAQAVARAYDAWAATYDAEMAATGYRHPSIGLAMMSRHAAPGGPVLDAGCGTGLLGDWLRIMGYQPVEGLDISPGMLARAAAKGSYARLHNLALGGALPFADGAFQAVISTGVFTTGHVGAEALPELVRITRTGGALILTVKLTVWDAGFATALTAQPGIRIADRTEPYISMPGDPATIPALALALIRT
jgi:predicted TPR repeat methyltransferase